MYGQYQPGYMDQCPARIRAAWQSFDGTAHGRRALDEIGEWLANGGPDVASALNARDSLDRTILSRLLDSRGALNLVRKLLEAGADPRIREPAH